jgi:hypothetical protein
MIHYFRVHNKKCYAIYYKYFVTHMCALCFYFPVVHAKTHTTTALCALNGCETRSLTLRDEYGHIAFENKTLGGYVNFNEMK